MRVRSLIFLPAARTCLSPRGLFLLRRSRARLSPSEIDARIVALRNFYRRALKRGRRFLSGRARNYPSAFDFDFLRRRVRAATDFRVVSGTRMGEMGVRFPVARGL